MVDQETNNELGPNDLKLSDGEAGQPACGDAAGGEGGGSMQDDQRSGSLLRPVRRRLNYGKFELEKDPFVEVRRVKLGDGKIGIEVFSSGNLSVHGSSMNCFYVTTSDLPTLPFEQRSAAPYADNQDSEE